MDSKTIGLGDIIKQITDYFHLKPLGNCGCEQRRQLLNRIQITYPYVKGGKQWLKENPQQGQSDGS